MYRYKLIDQDENGEDFQHTRKFYNILEILFFLFSQFSWAMIKDLRITDDLKVQYLPKYSNSSWTYSLLWEIESIDEDLL